MNFLERLQEEERELKIKIDKLNDFIESEKPQDFNYECLPIMKSQLIHMKNYHMTLIMRLNILLKTE